MTREEIRARIRELERELQSVEDLKREIFLKATINRYLTKLGRAPKYSW